MYEYRKLSPEQREKLVEERMARGFPPHAPPHPIRLQSFYLLTAACYRHQTHLSMASRRQQLVDLIFECFINNGFEISGWVILPNHYHLLVWVDEFERLGKLFNSIHGITSRQWNLEEGVRGRKIWYKFSDRAIRSERHFYTTLNYIHYNPVKHGYAKSPYDWSESSVHWYFDSYGRQWLRDAWVQYPVLDYGQDWDD